MSIGSTEGRFFLLSFLELPEADQNEKRTENYTYETPSAERSK
jgi:hypothetical protein